MGGRSVGKTLRMIAAHEYPIDSRDFSKVNLDPTRIFLANPTSAIVIEPIINIDATMPPYIFPFGVVGFIAVATACNLIRN